MFKNVASQKITLLAIDTASNVPKTGDSANITAYVSKDDGAVTVLGDTTATELDATNAPGLYSFDLTQSETNADKLVFSAKSSTSGVKIVPVLIYTDPPYFSTLGINSSGHVGTVTTLTNAPSDSSGVTTLLTKILGTLDTGTHKPQTGDGYAILAHVTYGLAALKTLIDVISAKTTALPGDPADASDIAAAFGTVNATLATIAGYIDTEVSAIKAKTDNLPATPASTSDIPSAATNASAVRTELATELGRIDAATSTRLATASYTAPLDAAGTRSAVGLAAANLDTQLAALDALLDAILEDTGTAGVVLSAAMMNKIADHVRRRQQANVEASSDGDALSLLSLYGFIQQAQESSASGGTLTVKKTDGTTTLGTRTLTSSASADPITGVS